VAVEKKKGTGVKTKALLLGLTSVLLALMLAAGGARAACRPESLVQDTQKPFIRRASFFTVSETEGGRPDVMVKWFGHNFFQLISKKGTRIVTDPLAPGMFATPKVEAHAVTIGREHRNHNAIEIVEGSPIVLRGLNESGVEWRQVVTRVREVEIRSIPIHQIGPMGEPMKGAAFTFDFGRICVGHLGDLGGPMTPKQLQDLGVIDVLLIPIGGRFTMGPALARKVLRQIRPKVAIPMHYWNRDDLLMEFLQGLRFRRLSASEIDFTKEALPKQLTVIVLTPPA
jgi:L-ascorbate metabolism protein UlaG (beta-lactamase superfamily)